MRYLHFDFVYVVLILEILHGRKKALSQNKKLKNKGQLNNTIMLCKDKLIFQFLAWTGSYITISTSTVTFLTGT